MGGNNYFSTNNLNHNMCCHMFLLKLLMCNAIVNVILIPYYDLEEVTEAASMIS